jgi:phosphohistidine phosphatase
MNLYLLRHGLAADLDTSGLTKDSERPLTEKGERKLWKIADGMKALELSFDLILSSPYLRARQTAEIIAEALHARKKIEFSEALTPAGSAKKLIELLKNITPEPDNILLVGHEPHLSEFISLLVSGKSGFWVVMKKGGLCNLSVEALSYGRCAALEWLLTPAQIALMA